MRNGQASELICKTVKTSHEVKINICIFDKETRHFGINTVEELWLRTTSRIYELEQSFC